MKPQPALLELLGVPEDAKVDRLIVFTLLTVIYPAYVESLFNDWWEDMSEGEVLDIGQPLAAELDGEYSVFEGETNYEYIIARFGAYMVDNS